MFVDHLVMQLSQNKSWTYRVSQVLVIQRLAMKKSSKVVIQIMQLYSGSRWPADEWRPVHRANLLNIFSTLKWGGLRKVWKIRQQCMCLSGTGLGVRNKRRGMVKWMLFLGTDWLAPDYGRFESR
jgi:hypothetical protein